MAKKAFLYLILFFFALYSTLFFIQRKLIFPTHVSQAVGGPLQLPQAYGLENFSEIFLTTRDQVKVMGWWRKPDANMPIILYMHGNGMHIAVRAQRYKLWAQQGYGVFAISWRGYGKSEGEPSEEGLYNDGRAALNYIHAHYPNVPVILFGESLGSGVATQLASETPVSGVVLHGSYTSISDIAGQRFWFLPGAKFLVRDRFDSLSRIASIHAPLLIFHGNQDVVIPIEFGRKLAQSAVEPKRFVEIDGANHSDLPDEILTRNMDEFFNHNRF